jgi:cytochrome P450
MTATATQSTRPIPTPSNPQFFWGHFQVFQKNPIAFLREVSAIGPLVAVKMGPVVQYFITHPDYALHVLQGNQKNYRKEQHFMAISRTALQGDNNLFTSDGAFWLRERRIMQPAFHRHVLVHFGDTITAEAQRYVSRWVTQGKETSVNLEEGMMNLTMQIIGRTMFNVDMEKGKHANLHHAFTFIGDHIVARAFNFLHPPLWVPVMGNPEFNRSVQTVAEAIRGIVEERATMDTPPGDLLDMLLAARDEEGNQLSDTQLLDEMMGIVFAGHETTALTLSWASYLLATHPDIQAALQQEVDTVLGGRAATTEDLNHLPLNRAVIMETLRLYPAAWVTTREGIDGDSMEGYVLPPKALVLINIYGLHRSADYWEQPDTFNPQRFMGESAHPKGAYLPFGAGPRKCIGEPLAMMEGQLILATLMQKATIRLDSAHTVSPFPQFTLRSKEGVWVNLTLR